MSDRGSERMRAGWHAEVEAMATETQANVLRWLAPHPDRLSRLAELILEAPDLSLSGEELEQAIDKAWPGALDSAKGQPVDTKPYTLGSASSAPAAAYAQFGGVPHALITAGIWAGYWIPLSDYATLQ